jgi:hypothetical protein
MRLQNIRVYVYLLSAELFLIKNYVIRHYYYFATTRVDPRNLMHVSCASHAWFIFNLNTEVLFYYRPYITVFTRKSMPHLTQPLAFHQPTFTYLKNQLVFSWWRIYITLVPGLLTTAPPFASSPTLSHPTD